MKVSVVTDSSNFLPRALFVAEYFASLGHEVTLIRSDFDHASKKVIRDTDFHEDPMGPERIVIESRPYRSNISIGRLRYHLDFASKAQASLTVLRPDLIYALIPSNSLAKMAAEEARLTGARLVYDILDLWPESLPLKYFAHTPLYGSWQRYRDLSLPEADCIVTECALYRDILGIPDALVMHWFRDGAVCPGELAPTNDETIRVAYIGAIANIIDIGEIVRILSYLDARRHVRLEVIGDGEKKDRFIGALKGAGIDFHYHGAVYDEEMKGAILSRCDWGLNIMKPSVRVGLTMKSLDYMAYGLRLINNIPGDTGELIEKEHIGVNVDRDSDPGGVLSFDGADKEGVRAVYERYFTPEAAQKVLDKLINLIDRDG